MSNYSGLNYVQREEVKEIVNEKLARQDLLNSLQKLLETVSFNQMVREKAEKVIPQIGTEWMNKNLRIEAESCANNYMRNNFLRFFRTEISENRDVQGFIAQHLKEVEQKVNVTTDNAVKQIVANSPDFSPIFQSHLSILSQRNAQALSDQSEKIQKSIDDLKSVKSENDYLKRRLDTLEVSNGRLTGLSAISLAGVLGLGIHAMMSKL